MSLMNVGQPTSVAASKTNANDGGQDAFAGVVFEATQSQVSDSQGIGQPQATLEDDDDDDFADF